MVEPLCQQLAPPDLRPCYDCGSLWSSADRKLVSLTITISFANRLRNNTGNTGSRLPAIRMIQVVGFGSLPLCFQDYNIKVCVPNDHPPLMITTRVFRGITSY
jgi:hypothetical protein